MNFTQEQVKEISEQLDCGFRAFYHKEDGHLIFVPNTDKNFSIDVDAWKEEFALLKKNGRGYTEIEAMEPGDMYRLMAEFAEQVNDVALREELFDALSQKKPFRLFKTVIDASGNYRQAWFSFKDLKYIEWVSQQIKIQNGKG